MAIILGLCVQNLMICVIYTVSCIMMLECFFASESVSSSDALKFGLFFIHSRHFPAHLTTNFRSAIKSGAGETTVKGMLYSEFRRTSNSVSRSVSRSGLRDGKFMVGKVQCFYIVTYGKNKS